MSTIIKYIILIFVSILLGCYLRTNNVEEKKTIIENCENGICLPPEEYR